MKWDRVDRRGQKPGHEASSDEQLPLEVEDKFTVRARDLLAPQWPEAPFLSARTDLAPEPINNQPLILYHSTKHSVHDPTFTALAVKSMCS